MLPAFVELSPTFHGDTWRGVTFGPVMFNPDPTLDPPWPGSPPIHPVVSARMFFRSKPWQNDEEGVGYRLSTNPQEGEGTIQILSDDTWLFLVPEQLLPLPLWDKPWHWDFEGTDSEGNVYTYWRGTLRVKTDSTR